MNKWYLQEPNHPIVISSRVRLARNLKNYPFSAVLSADGAVKMIAETEAAIRERGGEFSDDLKFADLGSLGEIEKAAMLENHLISPAFLQRKAPKALAFSADESLGIMLNEEDHIRIQSIFSGDRIDDAWNLADKADDLIEEAVEYAFDKDYGYLTSCPTNTGTGLRASFMLHLPMLERTGQLKSVVSSITKFGMTLRGIYGEGTEPMGSIFQISNQVTMGKTEQEIIAALKNVTNRVIESEQILRGKMLQIARVDLEDSVFRSLGALRFARRVTTKEAMSLLSDQMLGAACGLIHSNENIYHIMMSVQHGSLQMLSGRPLTEEEAAVRRAEFLRERTKEIE